MPKIPLSLVLADDDPDDREMTREALKRGGFQAPFHQVDDGEALLQLLRSEGAFTGDASVPLPGLILLDCNMPRKNGYETLAEIRADPKLKHLPVVMLTTSRAAHDVNQSYALGANTFLSKPDSFQGLVELLNAVRCYWFEVATLPREAAS